MPTRKISIRLEEELLSLKPPDMGLTEWIREAIHTWKLVKSGELNTLLKTIEDLKKTGQALRECPNIEALKEVADRIREDIKALEEYTHIVKRLEWFTEELGELKGKLEKSLIYRPQLWERTCYEEREEF